MFDNDLIPDLRSRIDTKSTLTLQMELIDCILGLLYTNIHTVRDSGSQQELTLYSAKPGEGKINILLNVPLSQEEILKYFTKIPHNEAIEAGCEPGRGTIMNNGFIYRNPRNWPYNVSHLDRDYGEVKAQIKYEDIGGTHSTFFLGMGPNQTMMSLYTPQPNVLDFVGAGEDFFTIVNIRNGVKLTHSEFGKTRKSETSLTYEEANANDLVRLVLEEFAVAVVRLQSFLPKQVRIG